MQDNISDYRSQNSKILNLEEICTYFGYKILLDISSHSFLYQIKK